ncbi:MAG TPA: SDR family oxidoreductase [Burkholderiaceae bacterium]|nr:SDR family oxidoreductase [Burkholderiaceae bacterium]
MSGGSEALAPAYGAVRAALAARPRRWLVTGSAGFIGSHLLQTLLELGQTVVSLDNFATGHRRNLDEVRHRVGEAAWARHSFIEGDIVDPATCHHACEGVDVVLHQAALGSVPRSIDHPLATHAANATGFLNMLVAARDARARFVYAASSSTYGDHPGLPKVEDVIGRPLSPYAVTKVLNELYAAVFSRTYGMHTVGLRYFNVFGPRQDPNGAYAAVIPRWAAAMLRGEPCVINGDGQTSRDFCFVANAVQANLLAATTERAEALDTVYNVAVGERTTLVQLHAALADALSAVRPGLEVAAPRKADFRTGDVRHSLADISRARTRLGYEPSHSVRQGLAEAAQWYAAQTPEAVRA